MAIQDGSGLTMAATGGLLGPVMAAIDGPPGLYSAGVLTEI